MKWRMRARFLSSKLLDSEASGLEHRSRSISIPSKTNPLRSAVGTVKWKAEDAVVDGIGSESNGEDKRGNEAPG